VLDVGAGSGYLTSVLYHLASTTTSSSSAPRDHDDTASASASQGAAAAAVVVGIEHIPELTALAERNIRADGLGGAIDDRAIVLVTADGRLGAFPFSWP
jgi:protein-L-isoaspartate(D-aspartate) O-methyltransferase